MATKQKAGTSTTPAKRTSTKQATSGTLYLCRWETKPATRIYGRFIRAPFNQVEETTVDSLLRQMTEASGFIGLWKPEDPYAHIELISVEKV